MDSEIMQFIDDNVRYVFMFFEFLSALVIAIKFRHNLFAALLGCLGFLLMFFVGLTSAVLPHLEVEVWDYRLVIYAANLVAAGMVLLGILFAPTRPKPVHLLPPAPPGYRAPMPHGQVHR